MFFKSLLFLGAGAIIHFVHSNEMKDMGGLSRLMPVTHAAFLIACLAIAGVPPFAGFFSKEEILLAAFQSNKPVYVIALFTSALTAFYMFRLYFSIFWKKEHYFIISWRRANLYENATDHFSCLFIVAGFIPF